MSINAPLPRRAALGRLAAGSLLALGLWPGALRASGRARVENFRFIVVNDTHYMSPECGPWLEGVVRQMKAEQPAFVLHAGDLTEHGLRDHLGALREIFGGLGVPWYPVIGNHDYTTHTDREAYEDLFPKRINYRFDHGGWQFLGLDSSEGQRYEGTTIGGDTFAFVDRTLPRLERNRPMVVFTHFPLGPAVNYRPGGSDELLDRFRHHNLQAVFSGHWHGETLRQVDDFFLTTGRCCALKRHNHDGTKPKGYVVCEAVDGRIVWRFVEYRAA